MADDTSRLDEQGVEWVTIHNTKTAGQSEITRASWDEPTTEPDHDEFQYLSYADRGWKLGALPRGAKAPAAAGAGGGGEG